MAGGLVLLYSENHTLGVWFKRGLPVRQTKNSFLVYLVISTLENKSHIAVRRKILLPGPISVRIKSWIPLSEIARSAIAI